MKFERISHADGIAADAALSSSVVRAAALALFLGFGARLLIGWDSPFWFDEAFTGTIAIQPTLAGLIQDCLRELSGPVYYAFMWAWEKAAGASDLALRLPSLIFGLAAPLLILLSGEDRRTRWTWAAITMLWVPAIHFASEARSYSLLLLLGTGQVIAFRRLLSAPTRSRAAVWALLSGALILTHYYSLMITGFQALAYLAVHRSTALRTWPAAALFLPVAFWMTFHVPLLLRFASPDVAWHSLLTIGDLVRSPFTIMGGVAAGAIVAFALAMTAIDLARCAAGKARWPYTKLETAAIAASIGAIVAVLLLSMIRPAFHPRYLTPYVPGLLFGIAVWSRRLPWLSFIVLGFFALNATAATYRRAANPMDDHRYRFAWNVAAEDFQARGVKRIFFLFDNSTGAIGDPGQYERLGRFFHDRARRPVEVRPFLPNETTTIDPNEMLLSSADQPNDAIMWIYIAGSRNTLATIYPPQIEQRDPRWACRNYGRDHVFIIGCTRQRDDLYTKLKA